MIDNVKVFKIVWEDERLNEKYAVCGAMNLAFMFSK